MTVEAVIRRWTAAVEQHAGRAGPLTGPVLPEQRRASLFLDLLESLRAQLGLDEAGR